MPPLPPLAVIDTNIWLSGLIWGGPPRQLVQAVLDRRLRCAISAELISEFDRVLHYPKIQRALAARELNPRSLTELVGLVCVQIAAPELGTRVSRDKDDDAVLACAVAASADFIASGDADLLVLANYKNIKILTPTDALNQLKQSLN